METQAIQSITYRYTQTAAKRGMVTDTIYDELANHLERYGEFKITLVAESLKDYEVATLSGSNLIDYELRENDFDILTIHVVSDKPHWFHLLNPNGAYFVVGHSAAYIQ